VGEKIAVILSAIIGATLSRGLSEYPGLGEYSTDKSPVVGTLRAFLTVHCSKHHTEMTQHGWEEWENGGRCMYHRLLMVEN
jgi:hypothetical protein